MQPAPLGPVKCSPKSMRTSLLVLAHGVGDVVGERIGVHHCGRGARPPLSHLQPTLARHVPPPYAARLHVCDCRRTGTQFCPFWPR